jgi:maleate isomerase
VSAARVRLGMITPSSNTVLEPVTARLLARRPDVSAHFARFRVTEISAGAASDAQFDPAPMIAAAELLADARCHAICWNGTSASWLGIDRDRTLCDAIRARTGIPATTAVLACLDEFRGAGVKRFGLVTPYVEAVQSRIVANFAREGFECVAERHVGLHVNFEFAGVDRPTVERLAREVAPAKPDAIAILCTNVDGADAAESLERELGIRVVDSVAVALRGTLRLACAGC